MKLVTYRYRGKETFGVVVGDGVIDAGSLLAGAGLTSIRAVLAAGALNRVAEAARGRAPDARLADIEFVPVIPDPPRIFCIGLNYEAHRVETGRDRPQFPPVFVRFPESQVGHRQPLVKPLESNKFDYEGELAVIIGKAGRRVAADQAMSHVAGFSCYHDGSVRDWQGHAQQWTPGKNFPGTGGFGPWLVTTDEMPADLNSVTVVTRVNGAEMQRGALNDLIHSVPALIAYISTFTPLVPGDVIATGTPGGVGFVRKPPVYLKAGDAVEVEIAGVGTLFHPVIAE